MIDLKIIVIRDLLTVTEADYAKNVSPPSLLITGEKLDETSKILINDLEAPEYMVLSKNRLLAQIPDSQRSSIITKLAVLAESPSVTRSSLLHFELTSFKSLKGIERLVQLFVKLLLQTPGSDKFEQSLGGGLMSIIGKNISRHDSKSVQSAVVSAVTRTRDQILSIQGKDGRIPLDERLLTAKTEAIGFDPNTTTVAARVALSAVSGRQAVANLTF